MCQACACYVPLGQPCATGRGVSPKEMPPTGTSLSSAGQLPAGEWDLEWGKALSSPNSGSGALEGVVRGQQREGSVWGHLGRLMWPVAACASVIALSSCNFCLQRCLWLHLFSLTSGPPAGPSPHSPFSRTATKAHNSCHSYGGSLYLPILRVPQTPP